MKITWKKIRKVWAITGTVVFVLFTAWNLIAYQTWGVDDAVLESDERVAVDIDDETLSFTPRTSKKTALVFFSGALVDPEAYAPLARALAEHGYKAVIVKLPFRTAPDPGEAIARAGAVIARDKSIERWVVGGHSKGGSLAARLVLDNPHLAAGLLLVGTSHPRDFDLSATQVDVTKLYATHDGLASVEEVQANAPLLPPATRWVRIEGGNHCQFGWYGFQFGDRRATISRKAQQEILIETVLSMLERVDSHE
jgi:pimeloyl-ACP methyl ester carboxylesterase